MELTLNIYKKGGREIEKTYRTSEVDIMFGTVEDIVKLLDFDSLSDTYKSNELSSNIDFIGIIGKLVRGAFSEVKNLIMEIFPELTEEEFKRVKIKELIPLIIDVVKFSMTGLNSIGSKKN